MLVAFSLFGFVVGAGMLLDLERAHTVEVVLMLKLMTVMSPLKTFGGGNCEMGRT